MDAIATRNIIEVLVRLDGEVKEPRCGIAINRLLRKVESDFDTQAMLIIFTAASEQAGHTIGPLELGIIKGVSKKRGVP